MKEEVQENYEISFATELLQQIKATSKRWFITLLLWFATIGGFIAYLSLPVDETVSVQNEDGNANYVGNSLNGDVNNNDKN